MSIACRVLKTGKCEVSNPYYTSHGGIDLVGANYTLDSIVAHSDGVVVGIEKNCNENTSGDPRYGSTRTLNIYGNYVKIKHNNGMYTLYAHLKYGSVSVNVGDTVKKGQVIAYMGNTGYSFGAHLHFEVRDTANNKIDPTKYVGSDLPNGSTKTEYTTGNYTCLYDMCVRAGAGLNYRVKKVSELTEDGKRNATTSNIYAYAVYKKGTVFTAYEVIQNSEALWAKTPSGYVCLKDSSQVYCNHM